MTVSNVCRHVSSATMQNGLSAAASHFYRSYTMTILSPRPSIAPRYSSLTSISALRDTLVSRATSPLQNGHTLSRPPTLSRSPPQAQQLATRYIHAQGYTTPWRSQTVFHRARRRQRLSLRWASDAAKKSKLHGKEGSLAASAKTDTAETLPMAGKNEQNYILNRLPDLPQRFHRPSKEELLAAATGFWSRLRVRFKWFSIRSLRPFNIDDFSAFVTWTLAGHLIWIIVGTTTFCSLLIFAVNTVFAQETLAGWIGNYLTKSSGIKVVFESAVVPKWNAGVITFNNVYVSRRPGQGKAKVSKGSSTSAAAIAAVAKASQTSSDEEEDTNYTQFDVSIESINVTLSFAKWFNGHGLLKDVSMRGVRGVVDRTAVHWPDQYIDPKSYRHEHNTGDFELESFKMDDFLISVHQPGGFRPFSVSIFSADLPQLRKQWLFYDMLSANNMSGSFDGSAFFIHPRQLHTFTGATLPTSPPENAPPGQWKKQSRVRVDGLNIDHLNRGVEGPFSWIQEGNVDIVADVMFPDNTDASIARVVQEFYDKLEESVSKSRFIHPSSSNASPNSTQPNPASSSNSPSTNDAPHNTNWLVMDMRVHLNDVHASIPIFTSSLSYVNNALVRPIVAYINSQRAFIPITCRVVKPVLDFSGSWTVHDSGLMEDVSKEVYDAFVEGVMDEEKRMARIKKVGWWGLQVLVQAVVVGLAGNVA